LTKQLVARQELDGHYPDPSSYAQKFSGKHANRIITGGVGHNLPQEAPQAFVQAIVDVNAY
jgi:pimeloyl-ACP methyl ester carboxylesterase